jgi:hypothetical protein
MLVYFTILKFILKTNVDDFTKNQQRKNSD